MTAWQFCTDEGKLHVPCAKDTTWNCAYILSNCQWTSELSYCTHCTMKPVHRSLRNTSILALETPVTQPYKCPSIAIIVFLLARVDRLHEWNKESYPELLYSLQRVDKSPLFLRLPPLDVLMECSLSYIVPARARNQVQNLWRQVEQGAQAATSLVFQYI